MKQETGIMTKRHNTGWECQHVASLPRIFKKHQSKRSRFVHILLISNDSIIFHVQSSKLLMLVHRVSRQVT